MSLRCRRFLIADDGTLCRMANARFDRMLRDPASHRLHIFAGQRVRMADVVVEVVDRVPARVVRTRLPSSLSMTMAASTQANLSDSNLPLPKPHWAPCWLFRKATIALLTPPLDSLRKGVRGLHHTPWRGPWRMPRWAGFAAVACRSWHPVSRPGTHCHALHLLAFAWALTVVFADVLFGVLVDRIGRAHSHSRLQQQDVAVLGFPASKGRPPPQPAKRP